MVERWIPNPSVAGSIPAVLIFPCTAKLDFVISLKPKVAQAALAPAAALQLAPENRSRQDSNLQPSDPKSDALPLRHEINTPRNIIL